MNEDTAEVGSSVASFSPDGNLIAIAREDNITQVLDSRFAKKAMFICPHEAGFGEDLYGITAMEWLDASAGPNRSRNVLVTGGDDGEYSRFIIGSLRT